VKFSANCNIYEFNACSALDDYAEFAAGGPECHVCVVSERALGAAARDALCKSAERVGYAAQNMAWVQLAAAGPAAAVAAGAGEALCAGEGASDTFRTTTTTTTASVRLEPDQLFDLVEALDPFAVVVTDAGALQAFCQGYRCSIGVGRLARVLGRNVAVLDNFEKQLQSPEGKQAAWAVLRQL
jgi:hypothetical protein